LVIRTSGKLPPAQTTRFTIYDNRNRQRAPLSPTFQSTYSPIKAYSAPKR
jgi:hypothetical protein